GLLPSARRAGSDGALRRYADQVWNFLCQLRAAQEWMARRASQLEDASGILCQSRIAHLHMARRAPSMFITRAAQNRWHGAPSRNLYIKTSFSDLRTFGGEELEKGALIQDFFCA
ncbi:hypothetical protein A2U01_0063522, partial [Trifolium medium]|nr:hypothetical protein [Trifolium medium]